MRTLLEKWQLEYLPVWTMGEIK